MTEFVRLTDQISVRADTVQTLSTTQDGVAVYTASSRQRKVLACDDPEALHGLLLYCFSGDGTYLPEGYDWKASDVSRGDGTVMEWYRDVVEEYDG